MKCPKCDEQGEKYWTADWGLTKYYRCLSCGHSWCIGIGADKKLVSPKNHRLHEQEAPGE